MVVSKIKRNRKKTKCLNRKDSTNKNIMNGGSYHGPKVTTRPDYLTIGNKPNTLGRHQTLR